MPTADRPWADALLAAAWDVVPCWGLTPTSVEIISLSENVVCDVTLPDDRHVVLRLHRPGYNTIHELDSEVAWVAALAQSGLDVAQPIRTVEGDHYAKVAVGGHERYAGMIEWVDGRPLGDDEDPVADHVIAQYGRIGEIAARIRAHGVAWQPPGGFVRRRWDADGLVGDDPLWGRFWEVAALTAEQRRLFTEVRTELRSRLSEVSTGSDRFGLIHADLHLGNLLASPIRLTVIDFDDAGYGWFAHELAVALRPIVDEPYYGDARDSMIAGYRRVHPLDDDEVRLIDVFLTVRALMLVGWLDARPELPVHAHFDDVAAEAEQAARLFLDSA